MENTRKELICIRCPLGCNLTAELGDNGEVQSVSGNTCPRGAEYAKKELTSPTRMVTSTVPVVGGDQPRVPVKTADDIPKDKIFACMKDIRGLTVDAPVICGQVLLSDAAGTGISIVAAKTVEKQA